jgi:5-methylcytosine-specific restriction enzyme A
MPTFLMTWNPQRTPWPHLSEDVEEVRAHGFLPGSWSCGNTQRIRPGDRVYLLRQGVHDPGLIGSGWAESAPYEDYHWKDESGATHPKMANYVEVSWDFLSEAAVIPRDRLRERYPSVNWRTQTSGISVKDEVAPSLHDEWHHLTGMEFLPLPEENNVGGDEGASRTVTVNRYERDAALRAECLAHHGHACSACGKTLAESYGRIAERLIHIHHLRPLGSIRARHRVNPHTDLCPVCPNCHAVMHLKDPPLTPSEVARLMVNA